MEQNAIDGGSSARRCKGSNSWRKQMSSVAQLQAWTTPRRPQLRCAAYARMSSNPYQSPDSRSDATLPTSTTGNRFIRITIYTHLVIVALTGLAMTHDTQSVIWSPAWEPILEIALLIGLLGLFVCPVVLLVAVWRSSLSPSRRFAALAVGGGIAFAHLIALLPSVQ
ncbi:hypothetical protein RBWH47_05313 [Rhodopirellula baltica WH47]|uniref:Uncharacterized protein n=2 Tax=Rhodopirellula baltica TaxID=265606 RepID=F2B0M6_RHOBT|nr:hypothetical protein RBWH47_05313 [Rhodopirellula baltica WH47]